MVESRWPLELTTGCDFGCGTALAMTVYVVETSLAHLPGCGGVVSCCVCRLCVVAFALSHDVQLFLLLK
jgi:hypothetical protein